MKFVTLTRHEDGTTFAMHIDEIRFVEMLHSSEGKQYTRVWDREGSSVDVKELPEYIHPDLTCLTSSPDYVEIIN